MELLQKFLWLRKLKRKQAYLKIKPKRFQNDSLKNILMAIKDEETLMKDINKYWENFWNEQEDTRYSPLSKNAFDIMKKICKYNSYEKRDGSIVNQIMRDDGIITQDKEEVSSLLISVLKDIQYSTQMEQYIGKLPFPDLPELSDEEVKNLLQTIAANKATSFDLFSDTILKDEEAVKKLSEILTDLWSSKLNDIQDLSKVFQTRLVALNKVHPKVPHKNEFRPIIIMSLIVKIMESRWLPKLKKYMISKMCPSQTGLCLIKVYSQIFLELCEG